MFLKKKKNPQHLAIVAGVPTFIQFEHSVFHDLGLPDSQPRSYDTVPYSIDFDVFEGRDGFIKELNIQKIWIKIDAIEPGGKKTVFIGHITAVEGEHNNYIADFVKKYYKNDTIPKIVYGIADYEKKETFLYFHYDY